MNESFPASTHAKTDIKPSLALVDREQGPSRLFSHPDDLLNDTGLTGPEKRAILASWLSDARAVENAPALRQLDGGAIVEVDALLHALTALDEDVRSDSGRSAPPSPRVTKLVRRRGVAWWSKRPSRPNGPDDDDDPPPCPAAAAIPVPPSFLMAA
jgi:hypothetical protein